MYDTTNVSLSKYNLFFLKIYSYYNSRLKNDIKISKYLQNVKTCYYFVLE